MYDKSGCLRSVGR